MIKIHLLFILILSSIICHSQSKVEKLDSLKILASEIEKKLEPLQIELNDLNEEIRILEIQIAQQNKHD